ncbi:MULTISPECIES: hypothetical protein [Streptomyces]|uniref:Secreted protein n=1 Tax=Streptomyces virginiae TaxID=1961 RepID=A0ABQ3NDM6_STRVG|nr:MULTISPECIES: hypothetical protein [Streptomyces]MBP2346203.1 hypothetical protein [Streptomyces virginiae]MCI4083459.1 hypothetical protein [Streptomyces sp. MMS21 TC-5]GGQ35633.1 hypothetical protein GCM10010215_69420 [Streptomyces virginiae]GHI10889.1 hypothetical protein Scinn_03520 [Streptomyces virginiae]
MSIRRMVRVRGGMAVAGAAVMVVTLAGCGGDGDGKSAEPRKSATAQSQGATSQNAAPSTSKSAEPTEVIATLNGQSGMTLEINSVRRDPGGFLTVSGQLKNTGSQSYKDTVAWRGIELKGTGESVAGATLVDKAGKKRYYVLRDTESRCLCTTGVSSVDAGQVIPFFAQFPAPPSSTSEVEFSLPTFATATVKISG